MLRKASVLVDHDLSAGYERSGYLYSIFSYCVAKVFLLLPRTMLLKMINSTIPAKKVVDTVTTHEALEVLYINPSSHKEAGLKRAANKFWFHLRNPKAVRNRLKLVKKILYNTIMNNTNDQVRILSLGSGSARAVLETVKDFQEEKHFFIKLLDLNPVALEYSRALAATLGITEIIEYYNEKLSDLSKVFHEEYDIIEMVGLLDYIEEEKAIRVFKKIHSSLKPGGTLITCNISNNIEKAFVTEVINWKMIYRSSQDLIHLLSEAGFNDIEIQYEPLKIHAVTIGHK